MSGRSTTERINPLMRACAGDCLQAAEACDQVLAQADSIGLGSELTRLLRDCAARCRETAGRLAGGAEADGVALAACAALCARCAERCGGVDDEIVRRCAEACLRAASTCRRAAEPAPRHPSQDAISAASFPASDPPASMAGGGS